jgi:hypothetical protein
LAAYNYLTTAEDIKRREFISVIWYGLGIPYLTMAYRQALLFAITIISLLLQVGYSVAETYPGNITEAEALEWFTKLMVLIGIVRHLGLFRLAGYPERFTEYSRCCIVSFGVVSVVGKLIEYFLISKLVDKQMPADNAGKFCLVATSLAQGLVTLATGMAHSCHERIISDRPGEIFWGFGYPSYFPLLVTEEKRMLIGAVIRSKCWPLQMRIQYKVIDSDTHWQIQS